MKLSSLLVCFVMLLLSGCAKPSTPTRSVHEDPAWWYQRAIDLASEIESDHDRRSYLTSRLHWSPTRPVAARMCVAAILATLPNPPQTVLDRQVVLDQWLFAVRAYTEANLIVERDQARVRVREIYEALPAKDKERQKGILFRYWHRMGEPERAIVALKEIPPESRGDAGDELIRYWLHEPAGENLAYATRLAGEMADETRRRSILYDIALRYAEVRHDFIVARERFEKLRPSPEAPKWVHDMQRSRQLNLLRLAADHARVEEAERIYAAGSEAYYIESRCIVAGMYRRLGHESKCVVLEKEMLAGQGEWSHDKHRALLRYFIDGQNWEQAKVVVRRGRVWTTGWSVHQLIGAMLAAGRVDVDDLLLDENLQPEALAAWKYFQAVNARASSETLAILREKFRIALRACANESRLLMLPPYQLLVSKGLSEEILALAVAMDTTGRRINLFMAVGEAVEERSR